LLLSPAADVDRGCLVGELRTFYRQLSDGILHLYGN
jgi:hypothetical protein